MATSYDTQNLSRQLEVAGATKYLGFSGDGGPAVEPRFAGSAGVAVDGAGNLFIANIRRRNDYQ